MNNNGNISKRRKKAFTLVEIVIVLAITVVVLAIMYEFLTGSKKTMVTNEVMSTLQSEAEVVQTELVKIGTQSKKIASINGVDVDGTWHYTGVGGKLNAQHEFNQPINQMKLTFYDGTAKVLEVSGNELKLDGKVLSTHVEEFKIKPLDAISNPGGNLSESTGLQFNIKLKMKKGYTNMECPVTVNVKFRNKDV